ncbi:MAG: hypothetical protein HGA35_05715 [Erysipelotrichaceae bacterium]|nr:hypothetical protein [Erysipelotrichaceae bacterium]
MVNLDTLKQIQATTLNKMNLVNTDETHRILIGMGTCGKAAGAKVIFDYLVEMKKERLFGKKPRSTALIR